MSLYVLVCLNTNKPLLKFITYNLLENKNTFELCIWAHGKACFWTVSDARPPHAARCTPPHSAATWLSAPPPKSTSSRERRWQSHQSTLGRYGPNHNNIGTCYIVNLELMYYKVIPTSFCEIWRNHRKYYYPCIMADKEFEEFSDLLDELPQHFKAADQTYK